MDKLNASVPLVLAGKPTQLSYHQIVASCRRVVLNPQVDVAKIYNHIVDELQKYVDRIARECRGAIMGREGNWLDRLVDVWDLYDRRVVSVGRVLPSPSDHSRACWRHYLSTSTVCMLPNVAIASLFGES